MEAELDEKGKLDVAATVLGSEFRRAKGLLAAKPSPLQGADQDDPQRHPTSAFSVAPRSAGELQFSLSSVAEFAEWSTETIKVDIRGRQCQLCDPDFLASWAIGRLLFSPLTSNEDQRVIDIVSIATPNFAGPSRLNDITQLSNGLLSVRIEVAVRAAFVLRFGLAFGVVVGAPYRETNRVSVTYPGPQHGDFSGEGRLLLASCHERDHIPLGTTILLTVSPGGVRAQFHRPRPSRGEWKLDDPTPPQPQPQPQQEPGKDTGASDALQAAGSAGPSPPAPAEATEPNGSSTPRCLVFVSHIDEFSSRTVRPPKEVSGDRKRRR